LKVESVTLIILTICLFFTFYSTFLSFQATDDILKKQLVTFAAYSLVIGVIIFASLAVYLGIKKAFSKVEIQLKKRAESLEDDEN